MVPALDEAEPHLEEMLVVSYSDVIDILYENFKKRGRNKPMSKELEAARELVRMLEEQEKSKKVELSTLKEGDVFKIDDTDFIVLYQNTSANTTKVISKDLLIKGEKFGPSRDYNESNIKNLLESNVLPKIEQEVGADNIVEHEVNLISVDMQREFDDVKCKIRPLTFDEAREFNDLLANTDLEDWYWTLTPWSTKERGWEYSVAVVAPAGIIDWHFYDYGCGVRPICIFKSAILVSKGE